MNQVVILFMRDMFSLTEQNLNLQGENISMQIKF